MSLEAATLRWLHDFANLGILTTDLHLTIRSWNRWLEVASGRPATEMVGQNLLTAYPDLVKRRMDRFYAQALAGQVTILSQRFHRYLLPLPTEDGSFMQQSAQIAPLSTDDTIIGTITVIQDVTERVAYEHELRQRIDQQEALIQELDAFAHTVAHDLKNPLTLILGHMLLLEEQEDRLPPEVRKESIRTVARSARKMQNIIDELLLLANVRKGQVEAVPLDMGKIVQEAMQRLTYLIDEAGARITVPDRWPRALGYAPWIEEVWTNYLSNALRYGGYGDAPPRIELGAEPLTNGQVRFWVRDYGPGLSSAEQAQLFREFTRLGQARVQGHGLGLSIVRRIVEKLDGTVGVESEGIPGRGSTFYFTLPAADTVD